MQNGIRFCFSVLLLIGLMGCSRDAGEGEQSREVKLVLNWVAEPEFGGFYAGELVGAYEERGLGVRIQAGGPGTPTMEVVAAGQAEFGIASADEVVIGRARGMDVVGLFAVYQTCPQGIMVRESMGRGSLESLFGPGGDGERVTLVVEQGLAYVKYFERKYGFEHVKVVPFAGGVAQFLADESVAQQCFVFSEPIAVKRQGVDARVLLVAESGYNPYTTVVVSRGEYVRENAELVKAFVEAVGEGWRAYLDDPAPGNELMHKLNSTLDMQTFGEAAEAQKELVETQETRESGLGVMKVERWEMLIEQLVELGVVKAEEAPRAEECFVDVGVIGRSGVAINALDDVPAEQRVIIIESEVDETAGMVEVRVTDEGAGISAENMSRVFEQGFTARKQGHGFGLHSSILAAKALDGTLSVHSEGMGMGATFTLRVPVQPAKQTTGATYEHTNSN